MTFLESKNSPNATASLIAKRGGFEIWSILYDDVDGIEIFDIGDSRYSLGDKVETWSVATDGSAEFLLGSSDSIQTLHIGIGGNLIGLNVLRQDPAAPMNSVRAWTQVGPNRIEFADGYFRAMIVDYTTGEVVWSDDSVRGNLTSYDEFSGVWSYWRDNNPVGYIVTTDGPARFTPGFSYPDNPLSTEFNLDIEELRLDLPLREVKLTAGSVRIEMLRLAKEVYGPEKTFSDKAEALAYEDDHESRFSEDISKLAEIRKWRPLSATEIGMASRDNAATGDLKYSFAGGHYQAYLTGESFLSDKPEANALVLAGFVKGQYTLAISIRGTDQFADFSNYPTFRDHYSKFKPLIDALKIYVAETGVAQVLISGHSLGAGVAQYLVSELPHVPVKMFTDGSPGSEANTEDVRVENWINTDDLVPWLGDQTHITGGGPAIAAALFFSGVAEKLALVIGPIETSKVLSVFATMQRKDRAGGEIIIDSDVADVYGTSEHDAGLYVQQVVKLLQFANDVDSPFATSEKSKDLVAALKNDTVYAGLEIRIALGMPITPGADGMIGPGAGDIGGPNQAVDYFAKFKTHVRAYTDDDFVLANNDSDDVIEVYGLFAGSHLIASKLRKIDGGTGFDTLNLAKLSIGSNSFETSSSGDGGWVIKQKQAGSTTGSVTSQFDVGTLYRVEAIYFRDLCKFPDGRVAKIQSPPSPGSMPPSFGPPAVPPTFILDSFFDYADAGNGSFSVIGTNLSDLPYVGFGSKQVSLGDGDDTFIAKLDVTAAAVDQNVVDGGAGSDILIGGSARDLLIGGADDDDLSGDAGNDALLGGAGADRIAGGEGSDFAFGGEFNADGSFKAGSGNDGINGDAGDDGLWGFDGDDVLDGGDGSDGLVGGAGNDMLAGGAGGDFLFGGDFTATGAFAANSGNDVLSGGEGNDGLWGFDGDDAISGDAGNDVAFGGAGADVIEGGADNDYLLGEDGDDQVAGGAGFDYLYGGAGADTFVFRKGDSADWILDFSATQGDKLKFEGFGYASFAAIPLTDLSSPGNPAVQLTFIEGGKVDQLTVFGATLAQLNATNVLVA